MKNFKTKLLLAASLAVVCSQSFALGLGDVLMNSAGSNLKGINMAATATAYVIGVISGITGIMKIRKYMKEPDRESLVPAFGYLLTAALLIALPSSLSTATDTVFSGGATTNSISGMQPR
jgi:purine-cytosine permease-like protein